MLAGMSRPFDHVIIIMFENEYRSYVMANPYMRRLARQGIDLANHHGAMHPSQTNYIASVAGQLCGVTYDNDPRAPGSGAVLDARCIVDLMQPTGGPAKIEWKAYMENYVGDLTWVAQPPYYTKHNPFYMFDGVQRDPARRARIVDAAQLLRDVESGQLPHYAWVTPNIWNDGHYLRGTTLAPCIRHLLVNQLAQWLEHELFGPLRFPGPHSKLPPRTLVVVTFDEADYESVAGSSAYEGPNQIYTVLLGDLAAIVPGTVIHEGYNHYSLLRTIEDNFELGTLGTNDAAASALRFLWGETFAWSNPLVLPPPGAGVHDPVQVQYTPLATTTGVALGTYAGAAYLISQGNGSDQVGYVSRFDGHTWTAAAAIPGLTTLAGPMALAGWADGLMLVYFADGVLTCMTYTDAGGWASPIALPQAGAGVGPLALASFDGDASLMLVFHGASGLASMIYTAGSWATPLAIAAADASSVAAGSNLALAELGNLLLLVYQAEGSGTLTGLTYSLVDFNTVSASGTIPSPPHVWSMQPATLSHLPGTPELPEPQTFTTTGPLAMAHLDGGLYLSWAVPEPAPREDPYGQFFATDWVHWSCYSMAGVLTSARPLSSAATSIPFAYGTLSEASWGPVHRLTGAGRRSGAGWMAMTRLGDRLVLAFGPADAMPSEQGYAPINAVFVSEGRFSA
jgi:hypothetical protein